MSYNPFKAVEEFEKALAEYCGAPYCVAVDSCTNAFFLTLKFLDLKNKVMLFPRKTYLSMPMMALATDNKVVFKDYTWKGIYPIIVLSRPDLCLIDSAKRLRKNDYIPHSTMFKSFHMKKHITSVSGKGGAILTDNKELYDWCVKARWEGRTPYTDYKDSEQDIEIIGYNMNMTPEEATFLHRQLQKCPDYMEDLNEPGGYRNLDEFTVFKNCDILTFKQDPFFIS